MKIKLCPAVALLVFGILLTADVSACTTGLADGKATGNGRCLLWKNRNSNHRNNEMIFLSHDRTTKQDRLRFDPYKLLGKFSLA